MIDIYHPHPAMRLAAARAVRQPLSELPPHWPQYWTGVSNPWLVFLRPSPGNSHGKTAASAGYSIPTLGAPHSHVETYVDTNGFWQRTREWNLIGRSERQESGCTE